MYNMSISYKIIANYTVIYNTIFGLIALMELKAKLGKRIKELREIKGISQEYVAEFLNIHPANYWRIENGISYPKPENLEKICEILNVKINELFTFEHIQNIEYIKNELKKIINEDEKMTILMYKFVKTLQG